MFLSFTLTILPRMAILDDWYSITCHRLPSISTTIPRRKSVGWIIGCSSVAGSCRGSAVERRTSESVVPCRAIAAEPSQGHAGTGHGCRGPAPLPRVEPAAHMLTHKVYGVTGSTVNRPGGRAVGRVQSMAPLQLHTTSCETPACTAQ